MKHTFEILISIFKRLFDGIAEARMAQAREMVRTRHFHWE